MIKKLKEDIQIDNLTFTKDFELEAYENGFYYNLYNDGCMMVRVSKDYLDQYCYTENEIRKLKLEKIDQANLIEVIEITDEDLKDHSIGWMNSWK